MNPGLPGLGIGGLYYILSALAMPLIAVLRSLQRAPLAPSRWRLAVRQCVIAIGIAASMTFTFWALDFATSLHVAAAAGSAHPSWHHMRISALLLTACVLGTPLGAMPLARL